MTSPPVPPDPPEPGTPANRVGPADHGYAPTGGYEVPSYLGVPGHDPMAGHPAAAYDPLISPDYNGWWRRTIVIVTGGWRHLALLQLIGVAAALLIQIPVVIWSVTATESMAVVDGGDFLVVVAAAGGATFFAVLVAAAVAMASIRVGTAVAIGGRPSVGDALGGAVGRVFPLMGWQIVAGFIIVAGVCACVLPAVYLYAVFVTLPAVVAFERTNVISRCFQLFHRGDLGAALARIATIAGLTVGAMMVATFLNTVIGLVTGVSTGQFSLEPVETGLTTGETLIGPVLTTLVSVLVSAAAAVFTAPLTLTAYADLRARVEPTSTEMLARELGLEPPPAATPGGFAPYS